MSPIRKSEAELLADPLERCGGTRQDLSSIRKQCAQRLQRQLQDPRLRAEKASQVIHRSANPGQNKVARSGTPSGGPATRPRHPYRSTSVSSQQGRCRPQSAGASRRSPTNNSVELQKQNRPAQSAVAARPASARNADKSHSRPHSARPGRPAGHNPWDVSKRMSTSVERARGHGTVVDSQVLVSCRHLAKEIAGGIDRVQQAIPQDAYMKQEQSHSAMQRRVDHVSLDLTDKLAGAVSVETSAPSPRTPLGVPAAVTATNSGSMLTSLPSAAGQSQALDGMLAMPADPSTKFQSSAQHYCIADTTQPPYCPEQARQFSEVAKSLESAAKALREMSKVNAGGPVGIGHAAAYFRESQMLLGGLSSGQLASPKPGRRGGSPPSGRCCPISTPPSALRGACPSTPRAASRRAMQRTPQRSGGEGGASTPRQPKASPAEKRPDAPPPNSTERLTHENETLRNALGDAVRRLVELEGEQEQFMSEGAFDLVNSLCRNPIAGATDASPAAASEPAFLPHSPAGGLQAMPAAVCASTESNEAQHLDGTLQSTMTSTSWVYSGVGVGGA